MLHQRTEGTSVAALILYTEAHWISGDIDLAQQRLSDYLNVTRPPFVEITQAARAALLDGTPTGLDVGRLAVRTDAIRLVVPLDTPDPRARVPTEQVPIELAIGLFVVHGQIHRRREDPSAGQLLVGFAREFVPISAGRLRYLPNPRFDTEFAAVLVHAPHLESWAVDMS